jgi:hypothetical protein
MNTKKDIGLAAVMFVIVFIFVFGMVFWTDMPADVKILNNLYYITIATVLYFMSWVIFIIAKTPFLKGMSCLGVGIFSVNIYVELFLNPKHWTQWDGLLVLFVSLNLFLAVRLLEKIKSKK